MRLLLVIRNKELGLLLEEKLESSLSQEMKLLVDVARNREDALTRLALTQYQIVVVELNIPGDRQSPLNPSEKQGLELAKCIEQKEIPVVLLVDAIADVEAASGCPCVITETDWHDRLIQRCKTMLSAKSASLEPIPMGGKIMIWFNIDTGQGHYTVYSAGRNPTNGAFEINPEIMSDVRDRSDHLGVIGDWKNEMKKIGKVLGEQFFGGKNVRFAYDFAGMFARAQDERQVKIEFSVERESHSIHLEALYDIQTGDGRYWMHHTPVYRRVRTSHTLDLSPIQLRRQSAPLNCLIIESNVSGFVEDLETADGDPLVLSPLKFATREAEDLESYFRELKTKQTVKIDRIERVSCTKMDQSFWQTLSEVCRGTKWDIVHYAGHSWYCGTQQSSFVFFPGQRASIEKVTAEEFAMGLGRPRFVYLSSCRSSHPSFVFSLAQNHVASILGFRWQIDDQKAAEHAKIFYKELFEDSKSLDYAFLETRRKMHQKYMGDRIWAAPMLVMQSSDA